MEEGGGRGNVRHSPSGKRCNCFEQLNTCPVPVWKLLINFNEDLKPSSVNPNIKPETRLKTVVRAACFLKNHGPSSLPFLKNLRGL